MIQFKGLGEVASLVDGQPVALGGARQRRLLAMLLIHRNTVVSNDRLVDAVFGGEPTEGATTTLRSYIARIRRAIEGHDDRVRVITQSPGYRLEMPDELFDAAQFETAVNEAGRSLLRGDPEAAVASARRAIQRWTGDPYPEFDDEAWVQPEARRLSELRLLAADHCFEGELACGRSADIVPDIERMVRDHPLREGFRAHLMLALYRSGRQADALRAYQEYRAYIGEELGLQPSPSLVELEARIVDHDQSLATVDGGRVLHGYRLGERLGSGGDGTLYAARVPGVDQEFVLRSFRAEIADAEQFVRTFESDAQRLASMRHPGVAPVHDYWRGPGEAYLVTARLRGGTLHERLRAGPLDDRELTVLVERVGGALVAAESNGFSHRRIHASNILFEDGLPYLTDFALGTGGHPECSSDAAALAALLERCTASDSILRHLRGAAATSSMTTARLVAGVLELLEASPAELANPYKGLEAFDEADAVDFFGRGELIDEIVKRLHDDGVRARFVLVVGGSGTGKSSAVRAGLLPRLRAGEVPDSRRWLITTCTPGAAPFQRLGEALTKLAVDHAVVPEMLEQPGGIDSAVRQIAKDAEVVVVIDQLEELFTMAEADTQRRFLDDLAAAVTSVDSRLRVVATLRADFYDRPLAAPSISQFVNEATVAIPSMTGAELEAAVVEPARRVGRDVEGALVAELVSAVVHDASALPALQFTLHELAERCQSTLTLSAYRELGGVSGAVAARAEQLYGTLSGDERQLIRQLFERMVTIGEGDSTRRRVPIADFEAGVHGSAIHSVIERWAMARLLTLDRDPRSHMPTVEVAHEALIREWPRLQTWIDEDREAIATLTRLHDAAQAWVEADRDEGSLYRGVSLEAALDLAGHRWIEMSPLEREFVEASRLAGEAYAAQQASQLERERRSNRRLRWQLAALACLLVASLAIGLVAIDQRRGADRARRFATARELASTAITNLDVDPERSVLLALEAIDVTRSNGQGATPEAVTALHAAVVESRIVRRIEGLGGTVAWSPTGMHIVSEGPEESGLIDLRDPGSGASVASWRGDDIDINDVAFNGDGSMLATTGDDGSLRVWDPDSGELRFEHRVEDGGTVWGPSFSGDGTRVAASWTEQGVVRIIDTASGELVREVDSEWAMATSLNRDGTQVAFGAPGGSAYVVDVATGRVAMRLDAARAGHMRITRFSPDGRLIAASGGDGITRVWDAESGEPQYTLGEEGSTQISLAWSADSRLLAAGSEEGSTHVWDVGDGGGRLLATLTAHDTQSGVQGVAFSPDGRLLAAGGLGIESIILWDIAPLADAEWANARTLPDPPTPLMVTTDDLVVSASASGGVSTFSMDDGTERQIVSTPTGVQIRIAADRVGAVIATAEVEPGAPVQIWDTATGERIASFVPPDFDEFVTGLAWSPDGRHLAVSGGDIDTSSIVVVDRTGTVLARFREQPEVYLRSSTFSPDGTLLAIPRRPIRQGPPDQQGLWVWDWQAGEMVVRIETETFAADWDPSGERLVTVSELAAVGEIWDVDTFERITSFSGTSGFNDVRFSPDGSEIATAGDDGDVNLWHAEDGAPLATLRGHGSVATSLAYAHDGRRLASIDVDGVLRVWAIDLDDLIGIAERQLTRSLTELECRQYLRRSTC